MSRGRAADFAPEGTPALLGRLTGDVERAAVR